MENMGKGEVKNVLEKQSIRSRALTMRQMAQRSTDTSGSGQLVSSRQKSEKQQGGNLVPQKWGEEIGGRVYNYKTGEFSFVCNKVIVTVKVQR